MPSESAIDLLRAHGPLALMVLMFLNRLGLVPGGMLILVTTGSLAYQGVIAVTAALVAAYIGVLVGDTALYGAGRYGLGWLRRRQQGRASWGRATRLIGRWGVPAIFLTRWLLLPLTIAVSLICGANQFHYRPFVIWGAVGNLIFVLAFMAVGYRFNVGWQRLMDEAGGLLAHGALITVVLASLALFLVVYRRLRPTLS